MALDQLGIKQIDVFFKLSGASAFVASAKQYQEETTELAKIKAEKGADYFTNYPSKDELMGDNLRPMYDTIMNVANMGAGQEGKEVDVIDQASNGKA